MTVEDRIAKARELAFMLRDAVVKLRTATSAVFLGPASGCGISTRLRLRDELERFGYRVLPEGDFVYHDKEASVRDLKESLLAVHFPGDGLPLEGLDLIQESLLLARKTVLVQSFGSILDADEAEVMAQIEDGLGMGKQFDGVPYTRMESKTDDQVAEIIKHEVKVARFRKKPDEYMVGVACEPRDLVGARSVATVLDRFGLRVKCPVFETTASVVDKLAELRNIILNSQALICYWGKAEGKRLGAEVHRRYHAKAWYVAPPLDTPEKERLRRTAEMVLRQQAKRLMRQLLHHSSTN